MSQTRHFPLPNFPPLPTFASWNLGLNRLTITFDQPIVNQPTALANWVLTLIPPGSVNPTIAAIVVPNQVQLTFAGTPGDESEKIAYLAAPPDVVGTNGLNVAPFEMFFV